MATLTVPPDTASSRINGALVRATVSVVVWAASFIATKIALREIPPAAVVWLRFGIGVAVLAVVAAARREMKILPAADIRFCALLGFLGIAFHQWLQSTGLITAQASTSAWIIASSPVFIALLGWLLLGEKLAWIHIAGMILAALGVMLVVARGDWRMMAAGHIGSTGDVLMMISAITWALFSVISRRGLRRYPPTLMMLYVMGSGWIFSTLLFLAEGGWSGILRLSLPGWGSILFLGVLCSGMAYIFWYDALKSIPASRVGSLLYIEPLVAVLVAAAILQEPVLLATIAGGAMILLGVWLVNRKQ